MTKVPSYLRPLVYSFVSNVATAFHAGAVDATRSCISLNVVRLACKCASRSLPVRVIIKQNAHTGPG